MDITSLGRKPEDEPTDFPVVDGSETVECNFVEMIAWLLVLKARRLAESAFISKIVAGCRWCCCCCVERVGVDGMNACVGVPGDAIDAARIAAAIVSFMV